MTDGLRRAYVTELPPELEGRLQSALCRVHDIEAQQTIRELVTEQFLMAERLKRQYRIQLAILNEAEIAIANAFVEFWPLVDTDLRNELEGE